MMTKIKKHNLADVPLTKKQLEAQIEWRRLRMFLDKMEVKIKDRALTHIKKKVVESKPAPFTVDGTFLEHQLQQTSFEAAAAPGPTSSSAKQIERLLDLIKKQLVAEDLRQKKLAARQAMREISQQKKHEKTKKNKTPDPL